MKIQELQKDQSTQEPQPNLYQANTTGQRFHIVVPMLQKTEDGKQLYLPMVVLTTREQNDVELKAFADTKAQFKEVPKNDEPGADTWKRTMDDNRALWTIYYAVRLPNDLSKKWFLSATQVADTYTPEECGILVNHYLTVRMSQPHMKHFDSSDPNAVQAIIDLIKKDGEKSDFLLNGFTTHSVNQLVKSLVEIIETLQRENGSPGTPSINGNESETIPS